MKKIKTLFAFLMIFTMVLCLTACGSENAKGTSGAQTTEAQNSSEENTTLTEAEKEPADTGTTKGVAERIAAVNGGDLYEILPAEPYTDDDLNYNDRNSRSTSEQNDKNIRPQIGSEDISLEGKRFRGSVSEADLQSWIDGLK